MRGVAAESERSQLMKRHEFDMNKPPMSREEFQRLPRNLRLASKVMARRRKRLQTTPQTGSATSATSHGPSTNEEHFDHGREGSP